MAESGTPLYTLTLRMSLPPSTDVTELRRALDAVGERLDVDVEIRRDDDVRPPVRA